MALSVVYAVKFSPRPVRDLLGVAKQRTKIIPIVEDARHPLKYLMLLDHEALVWEQRHANHVGRVPNNAQRNSGGGRKSPLAVGYNDSQ